jgi:hypothetical protein
MAESEIPVYARYSYGRWVGICPTDNNAMMLDLGQTRFECGSLSGFGADGTTADLEWPADPAAIELSVAGLSVEQQNWDPFGVVIASPFVIATAVSFPAASLFVPAQTIATTAALPAPSVVDA